MRRWIAQAAADGDGTYWSLYEGGPGYRVLVGTVCKFVTRWRGYISFHRSPAGRLVAPERSISQGSAQEAAQWVVERLEGGA